MPTMRTLFPTNLPTVALTDIIPLMNSTGTTEGVASVSTILGGQLTDIRNITTDGLLYRASGSVTSLSLGTGLTITGGALNATGALPDQTGNAGKFLKTNGSTVLWDNASGLTLPFSATQSSKTTEIDYGEITLAFENTTVQRVAILSAGNATQPPFLVLSNEHTGDNTIVRPDNINMSFGNFFFSVYRGQYLQLSNDNTGAELRLYTDRIEINGSQVLRNRQPAIADLPGSATLSDVINKVNEILGMLRTHGLIAS